MEEGENGQEEVLGSSLDGESGLGQAVHRESLQSSDEEHSRAKSEGDVYPVETTNDFPVSQVLDAHWGVLNDEDSLAVGHAEVEGVSRITTVVPGTDESICRLVQQLYKLVDLHEVESTVSDGNNYCFLRFLSFKQG